MEAVRLWASVAAAHQNHLRVLVNAFNPVVVLSAELEPCDSWLAEIWVIQNGQPVNSTVQGENRAALLQLRAHHIAIWMTATAHHPPTARGSDNGQGVPFNKFTEAQLPRQGLTQGLVKVAERLDNPQRLI